MAWWMNMLITEVVNNILNSSKSVVTKVSVEEETELKGKS